MKITVKGWSCRQKLNKMQIISQFKKRCEFVCFFLDEQQRCSLVKGAKFVILFVDSSALSKNSITRNVYLGGSRGRVCHKIHSLKINVHKKAKLGHFPTYLLVLLHSPKVDQEPFFAEESVPNQAGPLGLCGRACPSVFGPFLLLWRGFQVPGHT